MASTSYKLKVDWNNDGDFADSNEDISNYILNVEWERGRDFFSTLTGKSTAGTLRATLLNTDGRFSSFNSASPLYGNILPSRPVVLTGAGDGGFPYTFEMTFFQPLWKGYLKTITPVPDVQGRDIAVLEAVGSLGFINRKQVRIAQQTSIGTGAGVGAILDAVGFSGTARDLDTGQSTMSRMFFKGDVSPINALRQVEVTENGFISETKEGEIRFDSRHARLTNPESTRSQITFSDADGSTYSFSEITQDDPINTISNEINVNLQLYSEASASVVWTHPETGSSSPSIESGKNRTFRAIYPTPDASVDATSIGTWTTSAGGTDYIGNTASDGSGSTITGDLTVALVKTSNFMDIKITNGNANTVYLTTLQARGTVVSKSDTTGFTSTDSTSETAFGKRTFNPGDNFISTSSEAQKWVDYNVAIFKNPQQNLTITLVANRNQNTLDAVVGMIDLSWRITLDAHTKTGLFGADKDFYIESERHMVDANKIHMVTYTLSPTSAVGIFWVVGVSLLETETYIAY